LNISIPEDAWVVILMDCDYEDWSPWNVRAPDERSAIAQATNDWQAFTETTEAPDVVKVYRASWIGERTR
jgi:hypothetical protein